MTKSVLLLASLSASIMLASTVYAATADAAQPAAGTTHAALADKDLGRLSTDGASAFGEMHLARLSEQS